VPRLHISKASKPNEDVRPVEVAKLPEYMHPDRLLAFHEVRIEDPDQSVSLTFMQQVLTQLKD